MIVFEDHHTVSSLGSLAHTEHLSTLVSAPVELLFLELKVSLLVMVLANGQGQSNDVAATGLMELLSTVHVHLATSTEDKWSYFHRLNYVHTV